MGDGGEGKGEGVGSRKPRGRENHGLAQYALENR